MFALTTMRSQNISLISLALALICGALSGCASSSGSSAAVNAMSQIVSTALTTGGAPVAGGAPGSGFGASSPFAAKAATPPPGYKRFAETKLPGVLSNDPSSISAREGFPKVALIPVFVPSFHNSETSQLLYGSKGGCWIYKAKIWYSAKKQEDVPEFSYCMPTDIQSKPRSGVLKSDFGALASFNCFDSFMPDNFTTARKNGVGPNANYHILPADYLSKAITSPGIEQLYFMINDMGLTPQAGAKVPCRVWVATSAWQTKDF